MVNWSWTAAVIGAETAATTAALISAKPKDPTFHLVSINITSFKLSLPFMDAEGILTVHVNNPNAVPIHYSSTEMSIFYAGSLLGYARVSAGSQPPRSYQLLHLPARLNNVELAHHAVQFLADMRRREMMFDATDIEGVARVVSKKKKRQAHQQDTTAMMMMVYFDDGNSSNGEKRQQQRKGSSGDELIL
ncbi:hypothetical protein L1987_03803 [Smallanthus sonchifolius]|uniref:Uncharacterized protein n=1 Tax=Smallanthus sonchifolius TaxID=185202 RepID=A0ACB9KBT4_9ASTR|nr:hypothetical protein L1987_03803 [Smallanthus sonchifolius]